MHSSPDRVIDLNADVGEGPGEEALYESITSANIACGGHAGDAGSIRDAVRRALRHGVAIGAHPSYPDRAGLGRVTVVLPSSLLARSIASQVAALQRIAHVFGAGVAHVKPHGALYHDAMEHPDIARAVADGVASLSAAAVFVGLANSPGFESWRGRGRIVAAEAFADRAYAADGRLVPRACAGALVTAPAAAAAQAVRLAESGRCETICIHGDTPGAAAIAAAVRSGLEQSGFAVRSLATRGRRT